MMHLTMGKKDENKMGCQFCHKKGHKRRYYFSFKGKTQCSIYYESYLANILPNSW